MLHPISFSLSQLGFFSVVVMLVVLGLPKAGRDVVGLWLLMLLLLGLLPEVAVVAEGRKELECDVEGWPK